MKVKDMLTADQTLFKNINAFDPEYIPEKFLYRDEQLQELASYIKPGIKESRCTNAFLLGTTSTGKTTSVKKIFEQAKNTSKKVSCVHINCQLNSSIFKIFSLIHKDIIGHEPPETGVPLSRVYNTIFKAVTKNEKSLLVALDDVNYLSKNNMNDIIYKILRAHEKYPHAKTAVWLISTKQVLHLLEDKVRSIYTPREIEFTKYSPKQMIDIMKQRTRAGLYPNVLSTSLLENIIEHSKNLREAIELTKQSVLNAENGAEKKVKKKHVNQILENKTKNNNHKNNIEKRIIQAIKEKPSTTRTLYDKINYEKSYSTFSRLLSKMEKKNLIEFKKVPKGRGQSRLVKIPDNK